MKLFKIQLAEETRQLPVGNNDRIQWPGVLVFENFPEGIMIMIPTMLGFEF